VPALALALRPQGFRKSSRIGEKHSTSRAVFVSSLHRVRHAAGDDPEVPGPDARLLVAMKMLSSPSTT